jgi:hypothetical protein
MTIIDKALLFSRSVDSVCVRGGRMSHVEEASRIARIIRENLPQVVDGRAAVLEMKAEGSRNWRQMEWIGFWFEHFSEKHLNASTGFARGPIFGNVEFDAKSNFVWDLKAHPHQAGDKVPLNDQEAVRDCIESYGGLGYVILQGSANYESELGEFRLWHDQLKGGQTAYQLRNVALGKRHRVRKSNFRPTNLRVLWIDSISTLEMGLDAGWLESFQEGMTNSNGKPRRAKFMLNLAKLPQSLIVGDFKVQ